MVDRRAVWPDFSADRLVHEDEALVVVDKPAGVPTQAAQEGVDDDLPSRLRSFLEARDGRPAYLGIHQRLDRETSGLVVYARRKEANRSLAAQFEGRTIEKRYLAAVEGWTGPARATLRHRLGPLQDGRVHVVGPRDRRGQDAITHVRVVERNGERALLELRLETGRTHQARAQLAAVSSPIAGDAPYGGPRAPRMLLHAAGLRLEHPLTGRALDLTAKTPRAFRRWLERGDASAIAPFDRDAFEDALDTAREERFGLGRAALHAPDDPRCTTAFRLINEAGDGLDGLAVDVYGDHLVAHLYGDDAIAARSSILDALETLGFDGIYLKIRPKQANVIGDARDEAFAPRGPARGRAAPDELEIRESGLPYLGRLGDGLSTGIFLDQRENRRRVRALAAGKRVLNLFAYTCPFTIAAAAGGATRTVSVDAARPALDRGGAGLAHAGLLGDHELVVDDVFPWLERARKRGERFDLVILDPPSYSFVGRSRFSAASDWRPLAARAMSVVERGGALLACTNHRQTVQAKLRRLLHEAAREAKREVAQMKDLPTPVDFPPPPGRESHLKSVLVRLA